MSRRPAAPVMPIYKVTIPALGEKMQTPAWQDVRAHPGFTRAHGSLDDNQHREAMPQRPCAQHTCKGSAPE